MPDDYRAGWLAFYSEVERRRSAPVPEQWELLSDEELRVIVREAARTSGPRRRLIE